MKPIAVSSRDRLTIRVIPDPFPMVPVFPATYLGPDGEPPRCRWAAIDGAGTVAALDLDGFPIAPGTRVLLARNPRVEAGADAADYVIFAVELSPPDPAPTSWRDRPPLL